jgi:glucose-1-phosphate adenylyltransferase
VIENSVIGVRAQIAENVTIRNTYIMGADFYEQPRHIADNDRANRPHIGVGANSVIENAIIDKNARIGRNVRIVNEAGVVDSEEAPHYVIRDKIVVIPKYTILQDKIVI